MEDPVRLPMFPGHIRTSISKKSAKNEMEWKCETIAFKFSLLSVSLRRERIASQPQNNRAFSVNKSVKHKHLVFFLLCEMVLREGSY